MGCLTSVHEKVREFHKAFGHPYNTTGKPIRLSNERINKRIGWMLEEISELRNSTTLTDDVDALADLLYFVIGTAEEMNVDLSEPFELVHRANMTKLFPDGKPHYNTDNKVVKPDGWVAPNELIRNYLDALKGEE